MPCGAASTRPYRRGGFARRAAPFDSRTHGIFVDGGVSPHGNPALGLFQMTQFARFGLRWPTGPDRLTIVSVGTGTHRPRLSFDKLMIARFLRLGLQALMSMMNDATQLVLTQMEWMGETPTPWMINSEVGDLRDDAPPGGKMFRFLRYDVRLEADWLDRELGVRLPAGEIEHLRQMDDPTNVPQSQRDRERRRGAAGAGGPLGDAARGRRRRGTHAADLRGAVAGQMPPLIVGGRRRQYENIKGTIRRFRAPPRGRSWAIRNPSTSSSSGAMSCADRSPATAPSAPSRRGSRRKPIPIGC